MNNEHNNTYSVPPTLQCLFDWFKRLNFMKSRFDSSVLRRLWLILNRFILLSSYGTYFAVHSFYTCFDYVRLKHARLRSLVLLEFLRDHTISIETGRTSEAYNTARFSRSFGNKFRPHPHLIKQPKSSLEKAYRINTSSFFFVSYKRNFKQPTTNNINNMSGKSMMWRLPGSDGRGRGNALQQG